MTTEETAGGQLKALKEKASVKVVGHHLIVSRVKSELQNDRGFD